MLIHGSLPKVTNDSGPPEGLRWAFAAERTRHGEVAIVAFRGRIGYAVAGRFNEILTEVAGELRVVLDFADVDYMSSDGVMVIEAFIGRLTRRGGKVVVSGVSEPVRRVCELAGLWPGIAVEATREDAVRRLSTDQGDS